MKKRVRFVKFLYCLIIIFCIGGSLLLPSCTAQKFTFPTKSEKQSENPPSKQVNDDSDSFFSFAIIWGKFDIKYYAHIFGGFRIFNPYPYNATISVIGYVDYEHKFVFKKAFDVTGLRWIGFIGQHYLFVIGFGSVTAF